MIAPEDIQRVKAYIADLKPTRTDRLAYKLAPFRKRMVAKNMRLVFGDTLTEDEIQTLTHCFYGHMLKTIKENIALRFMTAKQLRRRAELVGHEATMRIAEQNTGIIILTGHFGNWELAPLAGILNFQQFNGYFYFLRKFQTVPFLEKILFYRFYKAGLNIIPTKNSLHKICEVLDEHNGVVFIMDQHANTKNRDALTVDFFGHPTGTYRSLAMVAKYTGMPVIPTCAYRKPNGKHVLEFREPLSWIEHEDADEELRLNTAQYNHTLEQMVLDHPDQWLWMYNRFKEHS